MNRSIACYVTGAFLCASALALAQDDYGNAPPPNEQQNTAPAPGWRQAGAPPQDEQPFPSQLTLRPGTFLTVRIDQVLSSDRNQPGDGFSATLVQPLVVDGIVVAQRGQTIGGRVVEAQRAGRREGTSRLAVQLTDLTLVDGQQVPVQSQLVRWNGPSSTGQDVATVGTTTAVGAAIGAAADWGRGAAIGAGVGAAAGIIGVLVTRGHPTVIYPETVATFRLLNPVTVSTANAPQAFRYVEPNDYNQPTAMVENRPAPRPRYYMAPPPYGLYGPYPYYWGPGFSFYFGRGPGYFYGRGYYRRWR
jgi:hypothetical protein